MEKKTILTESENKFINEVADQLEKLSYETTRIPFELKSFCKTASEKEVVAILVRADAGDIRTLELVAGTLRPKPLIFITAGDGTRLPELRDSEAKVIRLPSGPENTAELISLCIENLCSEEDEKQSRKLEDRITSILIDGCITPERTGFHYLRDAIGIYIRNRGIPCNLKKELYSEIAKKRNASVNSIDHCIRTSIEKSWDNSTAEFRLKYFGALGIYKIRRPSPKEFISTIAERTIHDAELR